MLSHDNIVYPFEINPRISTTLCLVVKSGIDPFKIVFNDERPLPANRLQLGRKIFCAAISLIITPADTPGTFPMSNLFNRQSKAIIGHHLPPYTIAEIGTNHNQSIDVAKKLIYSASTAKFNCVKFQIYEPFEIVSSKVTAADYGLDHLYGNITALEMFQNHLKTPKEWFPELTNYARSLGLDTCATVHGSNGIGWASTQDFDLIKVASMDHNNIPLLRELLEARSPNFNFIWNGSRGGHTRCRGYPQDSFTRFRHFSLYIYLSP